MSLRARLGNWKDAAGRQALRRPMRRHGLTPMGEFQDQDVFVVGYPKSGNTWMQNILAGLVYGLPTDFASDLLVQDLVPDVHFRHFYRRYQTPMYFKSHHLPVASYKNVLYLVRDGRDVMVSYFHHLIALSNGPVDFMEMVRDGKGLFPCKWHEHVKAWLTNPYHADMLVIRYEDLLERPLPTLLDVCGHLELDRSSEELTHVIEQASFPRMQQRERRFGWSNPGWPKDKSFIRKGQSGSYEDEMPDDVLEVFTSEAADVLELQRTMPAAGS